MQGLKAVVLLAVVVALFGLASAAPFEETADLGAEQTPAMLVLTGLAEPSEPEARGCTYSRCRAICTALNYRYAQCVSASTCRCWN